jgi:uncharacterized membrane protein YkvA (DUF1232 family)
MGAGRIVSGRFEIERRDLRDDARQTRLREYAMLVPHLVKLLARLLRDPRVPGKTKAVVVVTAGYLVSPIDLVPDFVPRVGRLDDIVMVAFALDHILNRVPPEIVREHWDGDEDVLEIIKSIVEIGAGLVPGWVRRLLPNQ